MVIFTSSFKAVSLSFLAFFTFNALAHPSPSHHVAGKGPNPNLHATFQFIISSNSKNEICTDPPKGQNPSNTTLHQCNQVDYMCGVTSHAAAYYYTSSYLNITLWGKVISQLPILNTSFITKQCNFAGHIWAPAVAAPQPLEVNRSSTFWSDDI